MSFSNSLLYSSVVLSNMKPRHSNFLVDGLNFTAHPSYRPHISIKISSSIIFPSLLNFVIRLKHGLPLCKTLHGVRQGMKTFCGSCAPTRTLCGCFRVPCDKHLTHLSPLFLL